MNSIIHASKHLSMWGARDALALKPNKTVPFR